MFSPRLRLKACNAQRVTGIGGGGGKHPNSTAHPTFIHGAILPLTSNASSFLALKGLAFTRVTGGRLQASFPAEVLACLVEQQDQVLYIKDIPLGLDNRVSYLFSTPVLRFDYRPCYNDDNH